MNLASGMKVLQIYQQLHGRCNRIFGLRALHSAIDMAKKGEHLKARKPQRNS